MDYGDLVKALSKIKGKTVFKSDDDEFKHLATLSKMKYRPCFKYNDNNDNDTSILKGLPLWKKIWTISVICTPFLAFVFSLPPVARFFGYELTMGNGMIFGLFMAIYIIVSVEIGCWIGKEENE